MEITFNINEYLSEEEIKEVIKEGIKEKASLILQTEKTYNGNLYSNTVYQAMSHAISELLTEDDKEILKNLVKENIPKLSLYEIMRDSSDAWGRTIYKSPAREIMNQAIKDNSSIIHDTVKAELSKVGIDKRELVNLISEGLAMAICPDED